VLQVCGAAPSTHRHNTISIFTLHVSMEIVSKKPEGADWGDSWMSALFALWIQPFTAHSANWHHPGFKWKLILQAARGCAYIHVSHSVRKLTGVKAHLDCPNPNLVPLYGKTAHVEPHHHALHLFTWFFLQSYLFITTTPYHTKVCLLVDWVICCEDFVVKSGVHATENQTRAP